jgi:hypothetical protein
MSARIPTVKLTPAEWTTLVMQVVADIGLDAATSALERAIGKDRAQTLIRDKTGPALSKDDNRAIVRELYEIAPGADRTAKIDWAIGVAERTFEDPARRDEVIRYARARVEEDEAAGGSLTAPPAQPVEPEPVDLTRAEWWSKPSENGKNWPIVGKLRITSVNKSTFDIHPKPPLAGPNLVMAYFVLRAGRWVGGGFDGCGETAFEMKRKTWGNARTGIPGRNGPASEAENRAVMKPRSGEQIALCLLSVGTKTRTPAVVITYP